MQALFRSNDFFQLFMVLHYMLKNYGLVLNSHELHLTVQFSSTGNRKICLTVSFSCRYGLDFDLTQNKEKCFSRGGANYSRRFP